MAHLSLYRKYRSQTFSDLVGQGHVVRTLQNAISSGRIAHAYLFTGPRGTGKTSSARLLAKALCCEQGPTPEPCNDCEQCRAITLGNHIDVYEMDAASEAGVDDVRERIVEIAEYQPTMARYKVFIIDEVHDLSAKAFDALLKTIEEPPAHLVFVLATTEYSKVPPTIRSRCQTFQFHRGSVGDLVARLGFVASEEGIEAEPAALAAIARMADGGFRDALTLLEQAMVTADGPISLQHVYDQLGMIPEEVVDGLLESLKANYPERIMRLTEEVARLGRDPRSLLESLEYRLADLTRVAYGVELGGGQDGAREAALHETAARLGRECLLTLRGEVAEMHKGIRDVTLPRLWMEAELIRAARKLAVGPVAAPRPGERAAATASAPERVPASSAPPAAPTTEAQRQELETAVAKTNGHAGEGPAAVVSPRPDDPAAELWERVRASLSAVSKTMAMRLQASHARRGGDNTMIVEFQRQMDHEWVVDVPKRQAAVMEQIRAHGGGDWQVRFAVVPREESVEQPEAVELPAEGQRLEQLAKDILGSS